MPRRGGFSLAQLRDAGTLTDESLELVRLLVGARLAFLVTGGTGSGKTTLLSALLGAVDPAERIVVVEDATELRPDHPHVVGLEARPANLEGTGAVALRDLVRQALRMRPDRLVVGEVRDGAVVDLMAAMNTGHEGGCGTLHANSAADLPARIEALALAAGLGRDAAHSQLASALEVVLHMTRDRDGQRRLSEVAVLERDQAGLVRTVPATRIDRAGDAVGRPRGRPAARPDRVAEAPVTLGCARLPAGRVRGTAADAWPGGRPPSARPRRRSSYVVVVVGLVSPSAGGSATSHGCSCSVRSAAVGRGRGRPSCRAASCGSGRGAGPGARGRDLCDGLQAELAAGQTPATALERVAAEWPALLPVTPLPRSGGDVPAALRDARHRAGRRRPPGRRRRLAGRPPHRPRARRRARPGRAASCATPSRRGGW